MRGGGAASKPYWLLEHAYLLQNERVQIGDFGELGDVGEDVVLAVVLGHLIPQLIEFVAGKRLPEARGAPGVLGASRGAALFPGSIVKDDSSRKTTIVSCRTKSSARR